MRDQDHSRQRDRPHHRERLGKYVFISEEILERTVEQAVEDALYERGPSSALEESRRDFEEERFCSTRKDMMAAVAGKREALRAQA